MELVEPVSQVVGLAIGFCTIIFIWHKRKIPRNLVIACICLAMAFATMRMPEDAVNKESSTKSLPQAPAGGRELRNNSDTTSELPNWGTFDFG